ncbi:MAG: energy transducer TonB [Stellaceae bacterium]
MDHQPAARPRAACRACADDRASAHPNRTRRYAACSGYDRSGAAPHGGAGRGSASPCCRARGSAAPARTATSGGPPARARTAQACSEPGAASRCDLAGAGAAQAKTKGEAGEHPPAPQREAEPAPPLRQPAPAVSAPPAAAPQSSAAQSTASSASARATWQAQLLAWLEKYKRYPRVAQEQRQQGVVSLRFAIDRQGQVLSSQINKSSGFELLDDEVLALVQRAQPVPPPPPEISGNRIELQVPVAFTLRR